MGSSMGVHPAPSFGAIAAVLYSVACAAYMVPNPRSADVLYANTMLTALTLSFHSPRCHSCAPGLAWLCAAGMDRDQGGRVCDGRRADHARRAGAGWTVGVDRCACMLFNCDCHTTRLGLPH